MLGLLPWESTHGAGVAAGAGARPGRPGACVRAAGAALMSACTTPAGLRPSACATGVLERFKPLGCRAKGSLGLGSCTGVKEVPSAPRSLREEGAALGPAWGPCSVLGAGLELLQAPRVPSLEPQLQGDR